VDTIPLVLLPIAPAMMTAADDAALADRAAGRSIDSHAMAQRLGGWRIARRDGAAGRLSSPDAIPDPIGTYPLRTGIAPLPGRKGFGVGRPARNRSGAPCTDPPPIPPLQGGENLCSGGIGTDAIPDPIAARREAVESPVSWSHTAVAQCDRLIRLLAALGGDGERRFAGALVATMVRLVVEGGAAADGIADVPVFGAFTLRVAVAGGAITVLGLRDPVNR
jgi:hypothetical protein